MSHSQRSTENPLAPKGGMAYNSSCPVAGPRPKSREEINRTRLRYQSKLSIILTDKCNIACAHCLPECDSSKSVALTADDVRKVVIDASRHGRIDTICFTGGEPFLDFELLRNSIAIAAAEGLMTTVMTNAYWAATEAKAISTLRKLPGLTRIGVSTDRFHQVWVPPEKIINAVRAADKLGLFCAVRVCHLSDPDAELAEVQEQLREVAGLYELEQQPVQPLGRAATEIDYTEIFSFDVAAASCRSADLHAVNPDGRVTVCCGATGRWPNGHPLDFGDVRHRPLLEILAEMDSSAAVHAVRLWGPAKLFELAAAEARRQGRQVEDPGIKNLCELCKLVCTEPSLVADLTAALVRPEVTNAIAISRMLDFGEVAMLSGEAAE